MLPQISYLIYLCERVYSLRAGSLHLMVHCIGREWRRTWFSVHIQIKVCLTSGAPSISSGFRIHGKTLYPETKLWFAGPENICLDKRKEYCSLCPDTYPMRMFAQANLTLIKLPFCGVWVRAEGAHSLRPFCTSAELCSAGISFLCLVWRKIANLEAYLPALCDKLDLGNFRERNVGREKGFLSTIMISNSVHMIFGGPGSSGKFLLRYISSQLAYGSTLNCSVSSRKHSSEDSTKCLDTL